MRLYKNRYVTLIEFSILAFLIFFIERQIALKLFERFSGNGPIGEQFFEKINFSVLFIGSFIASLVLIALLGIGISKNKNREIYLGFIYSLRICLLLTAIYSGVIIYLYV